MPIFKSTIFSNLIFNYNKTIISIDNNIISAIDQLPDQTDNAGKFLTTNGEQVYWTDFREIKIDSVHYPEEGDTTIVLTEAQAVPSNINLYAMSVYVDGVHLNKTVDYGYNTSTRLRARF